MFIQKQTVPVSYPEGYEGYTTWQELLNTATPKGITVFQLSSAKSEILGMPLTCVWTVIVFRWSLNWMMALGLPYQEGTGAYKAYRATKWSNWTEV